MENNPPEKSPSFPRKANGDGNNNSNVTHEQDGNDVKPETGDFDNKQSLEEPFTKFSLVQALTDVDQFFENLASLKEKSNPPEIPSSVETLLKLLEVEMANFDFRKVGQNQEAELLFCQCLTRISKLMNIFNEFTSNPAIASSLNRASTVLHLVMSLLDSEFRSVLESCKRNNNNNNNADSKTPKASKQSSFSSHNQDFDHGAQPLESESTQEEEYPAYTQRSIAKLNKIASAMISLGYESECCMAYNMVRRNEFNRELDRLGFNNISIDDVQRMQWETLEGEISSWIEVLKHCSSVLFSIEQKLCSSVFSQYPSISERIFSDLALAVTVRFLNFAEAIALTKRSAEKLFKFLDMYETLRDTIPAIEIINSKELKTELYTAKSRLGEAAVSIFCDLENSIRRDQGRTPVPSGAVHPLTRYTMNYLEYACEYKETLEQVFQQHLITEGTTTRESNQWDAAEIKEGANDDGTPKTSPFAVQLNRIMDLLDENLEMKSKLYRDPALCNVFLMNNGRYILQKIKGSTDINDIMGAQWCRKRSSDLRQYHKAYTRETWSKLLQCLSHEGLQVNGKVVKTVLKERFKMFNSMFDEIHKTQSTWVVSDEQLQSELRVSVSAVVIPAYRSFLGRFQQYFSAGRQTEKYIKYQPEDIESAIDDLFDGNPTSMTRRRS